MKLTPPFVKLSAQKRTIWINPVQVSSITEASSHTKILFKFGRQLQVDGTKDEVMTKMAKYLFA
jgi:hypothetical protein